MLTMGIPTSILPTTKTTAMNAIIRMAVNTITSIIMGTSSGLNHLIRAMSTKQVTGFTRMSTLATEQGFMIIQSKQLLSRTGGLSQAGMPPFFRDLNMWGTAENKRSALANVMLVLVTPVGILLVGLRLEKTVLLFVETRSHPGTEADSPPHPIHV
jgi:hypothetical protein